MTPEQKAAHAQAIHDKQAAARAKYPEREREIFEFLKSRWDALGDDYDPDKHDEPALEAAAERFAISAEEAQRIYVEIDGAGLDV